MLDLAGLVSNKGLTEGQAGQSEGGGQAGGWQDHEVVSTGSECVYGVCPCVFVCEEHVCAQVKVLTGSLGLVV